MVNSSLININTQRFSISLMLFAFFIVSITFQNILKNNEPVKPYLYVFILLLFLLKIRKITNKLVIVFFVFSLLFLSQGVLFGYKLLTHITNFYFYVFIPYVLLRILPIDYHKYIVKAVLYLSVISFSFWILANIFTSFHELIPKIAVILKLDPSVDNPEQILVFTYERDSVMGLLRNAGFCHEPGAYCVILMYAIIFNFIITHRLFNKTNLFLLFASLRHFLLRVTCLSIYCC